MIEDTNIKSDEQLEVPTINNDYYSVVNRKTLDFLLGFIGTIFILFLFPSISMTFLNSFSAMIIVFLIILVGLPIYFFNIGRRFIGIGIISVGIIGLLLFGSCFMLLSGI